jgi:hypothetical protein
MSLITATEFSFMPTSDIEVLEAIADQNSYGVGVGQNRAGRRRPGDHRIYVSPNIARASVAREKAPAPAVVEPNAVTEVPEPQALPVEPFVHTVTCYDALIEALRARASQLNMSRENIDQIAGYPDRLASKILGPSRVKNLGPTALGPMLDTLGLKLLVVENPETLERYRSRRVKRDAAHAKSAEARWSQVAQDDGGEG